VEETMQFVLGVFVGVVGVVVVGFVAYIKAMKDLADSF
jgi:hypothetical protein